MIDICLLGTGALMPLPERRLAALLVRVQGRLLLIDCGEGTQVAIRESGFSLARIDAICITHFHADHISGLPGLLLTMGTSGRTKPVRIIGPVHTRGVVQCLCVIAQTLPFALQFEEIDSAGYLGAFEDATLQAFALEHIIPCLGFRLTLDRPGKFDPARARAANIPIECWGQLQRGQTVTVGQCSYTPDMVLGPKRPGLSIAYCTDTRPSESIRDAVRHADLFICEGTYGDPAKAEMARQYGHQTFEQAAHLAASAGVKRLLLTHFSPSMPDPEQFVPLAREIFPNTDAGHDIQHIGLRFET